MIVCDGSLRYDFYCWFGKSDPKIMWPSKGWSVGGSMVSEVELLHIAVQV